MTHAERVDHYLGLVSAGDIDGIMSNFTENACVEDPVGKPPMTNPAAIRSFYEQASAMTLRTERTGPIRSVGNSATFPFTLRVGEGEGAMLIEVVEIQEFADDGRLERMRAYWGPPDEKKVTLVERYLASLNARNDAAIAEIFAEEIRIEDPVGTAEPKLGIAGVREFYRTSFGLNLRAERLGPISCTAEVAAFPFAVEIDAGDARGRLEAIDFIRFDADGKIAEIHVHYGMENYSVISA